MKVRVDHLSASRGARRVVHDVSMEVPAGTVLGLVGANGSGKSTLLRAVSGIDTPPVGTVFYDEHDVRHLKRRDVAQRVAVMTQEHSEEFNIPVRDIVLLGRIPHGHGFGRDSDDDIARANAALAQVGADGLVHRSFSALSGGERQRVLFARALVQDTPVLVLDEPTNHLDIEHQLELLDLVRLTERTTLVALHDLNLAARSCDAIGVLDGGRLRALGTPDEVLSQPLVRDVFRVDTTVIHHPLTQRQHFIFDTRVTDPV